MNLTAQRASLLVFVVALAARVGFSLTLDPGKLYWPDEKVYDGIAQGIAQGDGFVATGYNSTPLWPVFLALLYKLFGHSIVLARIAQAVIGALSCVLLLATARRLFDQRVALWSGLALALYPPIIYLAGVLYMENFYSLWLALSLYALVRLCEQPAWGRAALTGVCLGLAMLSRTVATLLLPAAVLVIALAHTVTWRRRAGLAVVVCLLAAATVAPWTLRNWQVFGHFVPISMGGGLTLWLGNNEFTRGDPDDRFLSPMFPKSYKHITDPAACATLEDLRQRLLPLDEAQRDKLYAAEAKRFMRENPWRCFQLYVKKWLTLHSALSRTHRGSEHTASTRNQFIIAASYYPVLALGLCGMLLHARRWRELRAPCLVWAVFAFGIPILTTCTRNRLPTDSILVLFATAAVFHLAGRFAANHGTSRRLAAIITLGVCLRLSWCGTLPAQFTWNDEQEYDAIARNLLDRGAYSIDGANPSAFRSPGQPLLLAAAYSLDRSPAAARVWQSLLWGLAIWLAFKTARELGATERASLWTAATVAIYPFYVYAAGTFFPLTLFTLALLLATWALLRVYNHGGLGLALLGGAALGIGTLTIPYLLPSVLLAPLWLGRRRWREAFCVTATALIVLAPWPLRNWAVFGSPAMGSQQWINLWYGNNPKATASSGSNIQIEPLAFWERYDSVFRTNEVAGDALLRDDAVRHIREHPGRTAGLWAAKAANFFRLWPLTQTQNVHTTLLTKLAAALTFGPVLVLAIIGWWTRILDRRRAMIIVIYFATFVAVSAVTISKDRFRIPLDVYLMIFAAAVVERWFSRYKWPSPTDTPRPC